MVVGRRWTHSFALPNREPHWSPDAGSGQRFPRLHTFRKKSRQTPSSPNRSQKHRFLTPRRLPLPRDLRSPPTQPLLSHQPLSLYLLHPSRTLPRPRAQCPPPSPLPPPPARVGAIPVRHGARPAGIERCAHVGGQRGGGRMSIGGRVQEEEELRLKTDADHRSTRAPVNII